jgi:beta-N-acetylhexosaminidase
MKAMLASVLLATAALALQAPSIGDAAVAEERTDQAELDRMIGQMILVGFPGKSERDIGVAAAHKQIADGTIAGVVLFPENISSPKQLKALTAYLRAATSNPVPFIAVDQEGGMVQRLSRQNGHSEFPAARSVAANPAFSSETSVLALYGDMAEELANAGFNLNLAPVVDLDRNPDNKVIGARKRSFGSDPRRVTDLARLFIRAHRERNIATAAKHFPGHGSSSADSHVGFADIDKTWRETELEPYRVLAGEDQLDIVMVGHLYHPTFSDGDKLPASLSRRSRSALRDPDGIGFTGIIMSDDLEMGAVTAYPLEERVIKAVNAGMDVVVFSNVTASDPELGVKLHTIIKGAVADGRIAQNRIEQAYGKVMQLKRRLMQSQLGENG